ncbi:type III secretion system chaperone [Hahella aquimaris]|uniref:type III secretion system chaperone n=1 Tax=Hahella sp. HNIBRBA332 TaxID=3015983 RepID=UPI00273BBB0D|nr:type III secretion system chaperone [Hahella sp. HNIBRBA332]WLQ16292.1 type III secretion system chaperone [Hahella sp. HNIBRBA332]
MNGREKLTLILADLGSSIGLPDFHLKDEQPAQLVFDDNIVVNFELCPSEMFLIVYSSLGEIVDASNHTLEFINARYKLLLAANLFWRNTGGATVGLSDDGLAIMSYQHPIDTLDARALESLLVTFVDCAESLKRSLQDSDDQPEALSISHPIPSINSTDHLVKV